MDGDTTKSISTEEAKARLRNAASEVGFQNLVQHNPWAFLALALGGGYLAGRLPKLRTSILWMFARTFLTLSNK